MKGCRLVTGTFVYTPVGAVGGVPLRGSFELRWFANFALLRELFAD